MEQREKDIISMIANSNNPIRALEVAFEVLDAMYESSDEEEEA